VHKHGPDNSNGSSVRNGSKHNLACVVQGFMPSQVSDNGEFIVHIDPPFSERIERAARHAQEAELHRGWESGHDPIRRCARGSRAALYAVARIPRLDAFRNASQR